MAGIKHPAPTYQNREIVAMRGASMLSWLSGREDRVHAKDVVNGWELCGRGAIRKANWKAVFIPKPKGPEKWQLYDLSKDPGEIDDLAEVEPKKLEELLKHWEQYVLECGVVPLQPDLGTYLVASEEQMPVSDLELARPARLALTGCRKTCGWSTSIGKSFRPENHFRRVLRSPGNPAHWKSGRSSCANPRSSGHPRRRIELKLYFVFYR